MKQTQGLNSLSYFFDIWENSYEEKNGKIIRKKKAAPEPGPFFYSTLKRGEPSTVKARVKLYKPHVGEYFLLTQPLEPKAINWLLQTHTPLFTEREDLPGQMISFLISCAEGSWYRPDGLFPKEQTLVARSEWFIELETDLLWYFCLRKICVNSPVITYEQFLKKKPKKLLADIGLTEKWDAASIKLSSRQNSTDFQKKLAAFKNADEIKSWYKKSFLNSHCEWPD